MIPSFLPGSQPLGNVEMRGANYSYWGLYTGFQDFGGFRSDFRDFKDFWSDFRDFMIFLPDFRFIKDLKYFDGFRPDFKEFRLVVRNISAI